MAESSDRKDGKAERKRQPKWLQTLIAVLSAIAGSGITLGAREHFIPPASNEQCMVEILELKGRMAPAETRLTVLETKVDSAEKTHEEEVKLRTIVLEMKAAFGPGVVRYGSKQPE